jgi:hypothetical protein
MKSICFNGPVGSIIITLCLSLHRLLLHRCQLYNLHFKVLFQLKPDLLRMFIGLSSAKFNVHWIILCKFIFSSDHYRNNRPHKHWKKDVFLCGAFIFPQIDNFFPVMILLNISRHYVNRLFMALEIFKMHFKFNFVRAFLCRFFMKFPICIFQAHLT